MTYRYKNMYDDSVIEFVERITHKVKMDASKRMKKEKLKEELLVFKYVDSKTKNGIELTFKEIDFKQQLSWKSWKIMKQS
jgi:hypothetical protein